VRVRARVRLCVTYHILVVINEVLSCIVGSKKEWCFMCELEKLIMEGKHGKSPVSPIGILSHLHEIGRSFGQGREEDADEFLR
jgi:hypothetical protein